MENFEIICIGNELLLGVTENTNAFWLCKTITEAGGQVDRVTVVCDDVTVIAAALAEAYRRGPCWVVTTGGLGPTYDDLTRDGVAQFYQRSLVSDDEALASIEAACRRRGVAFEKTTARLKMAMLPEGAKALANPVGTAPGVLMAGDVNVVSLPGVPREMMALFRQFILPELDILGPICECWLTLTGVTESALAPLILEIVQAHGDKVYIKTHPKGFTKAGVSCLKVHLRSLAREPGGEKLVDDLADIIRLQVEQAGGQVDSR